MIQNGCRQDKTLVHVMYSNDLLQLKPMPIYVLHKFLNGTLIFGFETKALQVKMLKNPYRCRRPEDQFLNITLYKQPHRSKIIKNPVFMLFDRHTYY